MKEYWTKIQKENLSYFQKNLKNFLKKDILKNKYIIILNKSIKGSFDTFEAALEKASAEYPKDEFIIQQVIEEKDIISFLYAAIKTA